MKYYTMHKVDNHWDRRWHDIARHKCLLMSSAEDDHQVQFCLTCPACNETMLQLFYARGEECYQGQDTYSVGRDILTYVGEW